MFRFYSCYKYLPLRMCLDRKVVFLREPPIKNGHNFKIWDDMILKFFQDESNRSIMKVKKMCLEKIY